MSHEKFMDLCNEIVLKDLRKRNLLGSEILNTPKVFVVWSCKTLQNSKAILGASCDYAPLYEITMNGDTSEIYIDTYIKIEHQDLKF